MRQLLKPSLTTAWLCMLLVLGLAVPAGAHGGEDHGGPTKAAGGAAPTTFSVASLSEKFELLLRYAPLEKGQDADMRLFVSDYATNAPIGGATITVTCPEAPALAFKVSAQEAGSYLVEGTFPANQQYSLAVKVVAGSQADLLLLEGIAVGKKLPVAAVPTGAAPGFFSSWKNVLLLIGAFVAGIALTALLMRRRAATPLTSNVPAQ